MITERAFQIALALSLITHSAIFLNYPVFRLPILNKKPVKMEIVYLKNPPQLPDLKQFPRTNSIMNLPDKTRNQTKNIRLPTANKDGILRSSKPLAPQPIFIKPTISKPDVIPIKKKISLPPIEMSKINNPSYVSYYQLVREKIRRAAYQNYTRTETGEVYLAFVILKEGALKEVRLIEEKSSPNFYLREISKRSIKNASPFPAFPKELDYPQLSFNVIISFEIE